MKRDPDIHDTDARDFERHLRGGFKPDEEVINWIAGLKLALKDLGFDDWSIDDMIPDLQLDFTQDPSDYANDLRFCIECDWVGMSGDLDAGRCPECGSII